MLNKKYKIVYKKISSQSQNCRDGKIYRSLKGKKKSGKPRLDIHSIISIVHISICGRNQCQTIFIHATLCHYQPTTKHIQQLSRILENLARVHVKPKSKTHSQQTVPRSRYIQNLQHMAHFQCVERLCMCILYAYV